MIEVSGLTKCFGAIRAVDGIGFTGVPDIPVHWLEVRPCDSNQLFAATGAQKVGVRIAARQIVLTGFNNSKSFSP